MFAAEKKTELQEAKVPHTSPLEVREHLVRALHADLVGPYRLDTPGPEVLRMPPSRWYLTGFLTPQAHREAPNNEEEEQSSLSEDAEPAGGYDDRETVEDQAPQPRDFFPRIVRSFGVGHANQMPAHSSDQVRKGQKNRRQKTSRFKAWGERKAGVGKELGTEPETLRKLHNLSLRRFMPIGMIFLLPERKNLRAGTLNTEKTP